MPAKYTPEQSEAAFWSRVDKSAGPDGCWPWTAHRHPRGYGICWSSGKTQRAHRVAFGLTCGPVPDGLCVLHSCDRPECVNPAHLWLGTHSDNMVDKVRKGRANAPTGDRSGARKHPERVPRGERHGSRTKPESRPRGDQHWSRIKPERMARGEGHGSRTKPESVVRGERNGIAKLTSADIPHIRAALACKENKASIGRRYGVTGDAIHKIAIGKNWAHIPEEAHHDDD